VQLHLPADTEATGNLQIDGLTATTVPYVNSSKVLTSSAITPTQLGDLSTVGSNLCGISDSCTLTNKSINASEINSGVLSSSQIPVPTASSLGGVESAAAVSHEWINSISTSGIPSLSQPVFSDISGTCTVLQGCTGLTTITSHNLLVGNGTSNPNLLAPGAGTVLVGTSATADPSYSATPTLGVAATTSGTLTLENGGTSGAGVTIQNNAATSAYNFNLPATAGASGQVLASGGGGSSAMTWVTSSGGGSGSGINILNSYNYNAEAGTTANWSNSGGTFAVTSTAANVGNQTYSFTFTASASSQTVPSNLTAIPAGLYGQNCLLEFYYKGFDSNMTAEVTDGTNVIASQALIAQSGYTVQDMNFI